MSEPIKSDPPCSDADFVDEVVRCFKSGTKLVTFRCDGCRKIRQIEAVQGCPSEFVSALCECGTVTEQVLVLGAVK